MRLDLCFLIGSLHGICYLFHLTSYNPKVALLLGLIENAFLGLSMLYNNPSLLPYFLLVQYDHQGDSLSEYPTTHEMVTFIRLLWCI
jgi:hypothetical protein